MNGLRAVLCSSMALLACACGSAKDTPVAATPAGFSPYVDAAGAISLPVEYASSFQHIGSWSIHNPDGEGNGMHHVYTTADVVEHYRATGKFKDGAVLVKEVVGAQNAQLTTGAAQWTGEPQEWFVMVKDTQNRFPENALWGDGWGWALFKADAPTTQVATNYEADCKSCHVPAESTDWIYAQGYPRLKGLPAGLSEKTAQTP